MNVNPLKQLNQTACAACKRGDTSDSQSETETPAAVEKKRMKCPHGRAGVGRRSHYTQVFNIQTKQFCPENFGQEGESLGLIYVSANTRLN